MKMTSMVRWMLAGLAAVLVVDGHSGDASATNTCQATLGVMFVGGPNFVVPGDTMRDKVRLQLTLGAGPVTGCFTPSGCLTVHRLRFDLDCKLLEPPPGCGNCTPGVALPCTDQGPVVSYGGDSTLTTDCGVSWSTNVPGGGSGTNEVVFTPSPPFTIPVQTPDFCHLAFDLIVGNPEPTSGQSDATPLVIEEAVGFIKLNNVNDDATCANGNTSGDEAAPSIRVCPPCASDACTDRTCPDEGPDAGTCVSTPSVGQPCPDTDGNVCTIAGCEASPTDPSAGVCVQTHTFASEGAPCPDTDDDACTTAGCDGQGVCDQSQVHCGQGCFTRPLSFWAMHPAATRAVLGAGLPSCGLVVNTTAAATPVSSTEDICSVGTDFKANDTSPQQVQLIRQCMAAALNLAATAHAPAPGDCNAVSPGISSQFDTCCTGATSVCDSGASPAAIDASGCIGILDRFNGLETTFDVGIHPGRADPSACQASRNNGFLNPGRNLGPAS